MKIKTMKKQRRKQEIQRHLGLGQKSNSSWDEPNYQTLIWVKDLN